MVIQELRTVFHIKRDFEVENIISSQTNKSGKCNQQIFLEVSSLRWSPNVSDLMIPSTFYTFSFEVLRFELATFRNDVSRKKIEGQNFA